jgi:hypothetical protein
MLFFHLLLILSCENFPRFFPTKQFIQAGGITVGSETTNLLILFGIRKNCQSNGRNLLYLFIRRVIKQTVVIVQEMMKCQEAGENYIMSFIICIIKSRRMRWVEHVACMGELKSSHKILVGKSEGKI